MKLSSKIHIGTASLVFVMVSGLMISLYMSEKKLILEEIRQEQKEDLEKLSEVYKEVLMDNELVFVNYIKKLALGPRFVYAGYVKNDGAGWIYPCSESLYCFPDVSDPVIQTILNTSTIMRRNFVDRASGERLVEITRPVGRRAHIRLAYSQDIIDKIVAQRLQKILRKLFAFGLVATFIGLFLAHVLSAALSNPISRLIRAAEAIGKGKKGVTIAEAGQDELGQLTRTFNKMSHDLEKLDELKDDFMSHVTHELRSPLTSIIATVELMDEMPLIDSNPKLRRSLDRLKYGSERLNRLVDNILDLTRMEAGKMSFDIKPVDIGTIVCEMVDFFEPRAMEKNLTIKAAVPKVLSMAKADPERIRQVLSNLIHNAIKFTNDGGIVVRAKEAGNEIHVSVQDTGVGIPKDKLNSVFEKFECLKETKDRVKKPVPGSGLGLNIVLNSIHAQEGRIWVESEENKGTSFTFSLPIALGQARVNTQNPKDKDFDQANQVKRNPVMIDEKEQAS